MRAIILSQVYEWSKVHTEQPHTFRECMSTYSKNSCRLISSSAETSFPSAEISVPGTHTHTPAQENQPLLCTLLLLLLVRSALHTHTHYMHVYECLCVGWGGILSETPEALPLNRFHIFIILLSLCFPASLLENWRLGHTHTQFTGKT